ncbi:MAG: hypothetical protein AB1540_00085 [Bdellovibrionota bacterium]
MNIMMRLGIFFLLFAVHAYAQVKIDTVVKDDESGVRYQTRSELGHGAEGTVYKVEELAPDGTSTGRHWALKVIGSEFPYYDHFRGPRIVAQLRAENPESKELDFFIAERPISHLSAVANGKETQVGKALLSELLPGVNIYLLGRWFKLFDFQTGDLISADPKEIEQRVRTLFLLAHDSVVPLDYLAKKGYVFRDYKRANILIHPGPSPHFKLIDTGMVESLEHIKNTKERAGTPPFIAPETLADPFNQDAIGEFLDRYSIALNLWSVATDYNGYRFSLDLGTELVKRPEILEKVRINLKTLHESGQLSEEALRQFEFLNRFIVSAQSLNPSERGVVKAEDFKAFDVDKIREETSGYLRMLSTRPPEDVIYQLPPNRSMKIIQGEKEAPPPKAAKTGAFANMRCKLRNMVQAIKGWAHLK